MIFYRLMIYLFILHKQIIIGILQVRISDKSSIKLTDIYRGFPQSDQTVTGECLQLDNQTFLFIIY